MWRQRTLAHGLLPPSSGHPMAFLRLRVFASVPERGLGDRFELTGFACHASLTTASARRAPLRPGHHD